MLFPGKAFALYLQIKICWHWTRQREVWALWALSSCYYNCNKSCQAINSFHRGNCTI